MNISEFTNISNFLRSKTIPNDLATKSDRLIFKRRASSYQLGEGDKLLKIHRSKGSELLLCCPLSDQVSNILKLYHDPEHCGVNTTTDMIIKDYAWRGMQKDIRAYINSCHHCQMTASTLPKKNLKLHPIPAPRVPWHHIGMDLVTDLPSNSQGYNHILVVVCYLSKFVAARPLLTKTTQSVIDALTEIYLTFGVPAIIQHDQGREFTSREFKHFHDPLGVDDRSTTAYHPQANGLVEAHNKVIKRKLAKFIYEKDVQWPSKLQPACLSANSHKKRATKYTPFELMFGRDFDHLPLLRRLNLSVDEQQSDEEVDDDRDGLIDDTESPCETDWPSDLKHSRDKQREDAKCNIIIEQTKQKKSYDKKIQTTKHVFKEGDMFLVLDKAKEKKMPGTKDKPIYKGPFQVSSITDSHLVTIVNEKIRRYPIHLSKKYCYRETEKTDFPKTDICEGPNNKKSTITKRVKRQRPSIKAETKKKGKKYPKIIDDQIQYSYGVFKKTFMNELLAIKDDVIEHIKDNKYLSELHKDLSNTKGKDFSCSYSMLPCVLKDWTCTEMREQVWEHLVEWTKAAYSCLNSTPSLSHTQYVNHILYATIMELVEKKIFNTYLQENALPYKISSLVLQTDTPSYSPPTTDWLRSKCIQLGLTYVTEIIQPNTYIGQDLKCVVPFAELPILGDGNCLFRALSAILTGSQESFSKIRAEICRFIVTQGAGFISRYLEIKMKDLTPAEYLRKSHMDTNYIWGTDVEVVAFSKMLDVDIFVSNIHTDIKRNESNATWYRFSSNYLRYSNPALYLANHSNHYEPVIDLIHSRYPSFDDTYTFSDTVIVE